MDALISLVAAYHPESLRLLWTTADVAHPAMWRRSSVWDGCVLRCIEPDAAVSVSLTLLSLAVLLYVYTLLLRPARACVGSLGHILY